VEKSVRQKHLNADLFHNKDTKGRDFINIFNHIGDKENIAT